MLIHFLSEVDVRLVLLIRKKKIPWRAQRAKDFFLKKNNRALQKVVRSAAQTTPSARLSGRPVDAQWTPSGRLSGRLVDAY